MPELVLPRTRSREGDHKKKTVLIVDSTQGCNNEVGLFSWQASTTENQKKNTIKRTKKRKKKRKEISTWSLPRSKHLYANNATAIHLLVHSSTTSFAHSLPPSLTHSFTHSFTLALLLLQLTARPQLACGWHIQGQP